MTITRFAVTATATIAIKSCPVITQAITVKVTEAVTAMITAVLMFMSTIHPANLTDSKMPTFTFKGYL